MVSKRSVFYSKGLTFKDTILTWPQHTGNASRVKGTVEEAAVVRKQFLENIKVLLRHVEKFQNTVLILLLLLSLIFWKVGWEYMQF